MRIYMLKRDMEFCHEITGYRVKDGKTLKIWYPPNADYNEEVIETKDWNVIEIIDHDKKLWVYYETHEEKHP